MTLVEVLIALVVIFIGIGGSLMSISFANKTAQSTTNQMLAVHNVREQLEVLRSYALNDPLLSAGSHSLTGGQSYVVSAVTTNTKSIAMNAVWTNMLTRALSTTTVTTIFVDALH